MFIVYVSTCSKSLLSFQHTVGSYIKIQMSYHAKCLEALTKAYRNLAILDEADDLDVSASG